RGFATARGAGAVEADGRCRASGRATIASSLGPAGRLRRAGPASDRRPPHGRGRSRTPRSDPTAGGNTANVHVKRVDSGAEMIRVLGAHERVAVRRGGLRTGTQGASGALPPLQGPQ